MTKKERFSQLISDSGYSFSVQFRKGRTVTITVADDGQLFVRAPFHVDPSVLCDFVDKKSSWIDNKRREGASAVMLPTLTTSEKKIAAKNVRERANLFLQGYEGKMPKKIFIRFSKTRWGSCSTLGNISLNGYLSFLPDDLFQYVLYHELCHLYVWNHSSAFWDLLAKWISSPKSKRKLLRNYRIPD